MKCLPCSPALPACLQGLASIGTLLEVQDHSNLEDGRMLVNNIGRQRFKILEVCMCVCSPGWPPATAACLPACLRAFPMHRKASVICVHCSG